MNCLNNGSSCCSIIWILFLLSNCGCGEGVFGGSGCGRGGSNNIIWIILLLLACGGCGESGGGCGCGCN